MRNNTDRILFRHLAPVNNEIRPGRCVFQAHHHSDNIRRGPVIAVLGAISTGADMTRTFANTVNAVPLTADDIKHSTTLDELRQRVWKYIHMSWQKENHERKPSVLLQPQ
ncbi:unnamed protein product [Toxocara canis]|uniref:Uncharacterized protein n=1 Tax=Toxocara canis TaxID=6265 RepID=A0A183UQ91_TOXCA|nr:unnamed protein product [Toxocara canis]